MAGQYIADPVGIEQARLNKLVKEAKEANNKQVGGAHYDGEIQCWDYIVSNGIGYLEGNVIKYVSRYKKKNGKQDLEKAKHYLEKLIETVGD